MFYELKTDKALRFGDVLKGFVLASPNIKEPSLNNDYQIDINLPKYCVVLSPCCSIGEKIICLTPLTEVLNGFFNNTYLAEDLTRINREMEPQQSVSETVWKGLPQEEQQKRLNAGVGYALYDKFIYEENDLLSKYTAHGKEENIETNYYMIDFRNTHKINTQKNVPLASKCLQLSVQTRAELRDKIAYYYSRVPLEDKALLEG